MQSFDAEHEEMDAMVCERDRRYLLINQSHSKCGRQISYGRQKRRQSVGDLRLGSRNIFDFGDFVVGRRSGVAATTMIFDVLDGLTQTPKTA